jgi:hypothetical protein
MSRPEPDWQPVTVKVERHTLEAFQRIAVAEHRTVSGELRRLIDERIAEFDGEQAAA